MTLMDKILKCEYKYIECFCNRTVKQDLIRFWDELIPDMYYHNFTWIKSIKDDIALAQLIESEITNCINKGNDFCLIRCDSPVNKSILTSLSYFPEVSVAGWYAFDVSSFPELEGVSDCRILKVDKPEMLEAVLLLDLEHDEASLGRDFCTRRVYRRKDIYLSNENVNSYLYYHNGEAVGNCELSIFGDIAKIENFAIAPREQGKGYGMAMLNALITIAIEKSVTTIYLEADEDDTAKNMYIKRGFSKVCEFTDLLFHFLKRL